MSRLCGGWRPWRGGLAPPKRVRVWAAATVVPVSRLMGGDRVGGRWGGAAKMRAYVTFGSAPKSDTIKRSSTPRRVDSHAARVTCSVSDTRGNESVRVNGARTRRHLVLKAAVTRGRRPVLHVSR